MSRPPLILVKHAMPAIDPARPSREWRLSDEGRAAAARLAHALKPLAPTRMLASPEPKAEETARIMAESLGLTYALDAGFAEHHRETAPFLTREAFEASIQALFERPAERAFGEESADEAHDRVSATLASHSPGDGGLVVVCHGTVISLWVSRRFGVAPLPFWKALGLASAVIVEDEGFRVVSP